MLKSQPSAPTKSSSRHESLDSVESIGFAAQPRERFLLFISGAKYLSTLESARMLRLLAKAENASVLATIKGEITASERTEANHTRLAFVSRFKIESRYGSRF